jgi:hypothetical protein
MRTKNMVNASDKKIPENISEKRKYKKQTDLKNPKNILSTGNIYY